MTSAPVYDTPSGHDIGCIEHPPGHATACSCGASNASLARANGWDQPVEGAATPSRARGAHDPKTPAAGERVRRGSSARLTSACATRHRGTREAIV